jgi:membrane associated rhomboid family serine protease
MAFGPGLTKVCAWLIGIDLAAFLLYTFSGEATKAALVRWLVLTPDSLPRLELWKLATTTFMDPKGMAVFFNLIMLWLFVPALERSYTTRRFVWFFAVTSLVGNLLSALVGLALSPAYQIAGMSPFIYASIAAYGVLFAQQPVHFLGIIPLKGKVVAIGTAAVVALFVVINGSWVDGAGFFGAMGLAALMARGTLAFTPNLWWLRFRRWRMRRRYQVLEGCQSDPSKKKRWMN